MQGNTAKAILSFKNYQSNLVWRLFRDVYQSVAGATEVEKREARKQLFGVTGMMMLHAGISGTWLFGMTMMIASLICGKQPDELEEEFKGAVIDTLGPHLGGALWYGIPSRVTGISLSDRIGMPDLWFKSPERPMEGQAEGDYWLEQITGAVPQIVIGELEGLKKMRDGDYERGLELMIPKALRDPLKAYRYWMEGATTSKGDPLVDQVPTYDILVQALGFTPAQIAERNAVNNRLYNAQQEVIDQRSRLMGTAAKESMRGPISDGTMAEIESYNAANPDYPILAENVNQSARSRAMMHDRAEFGLSLNPKLNDRLRSERAPLVFN